MAALVPGGRLLVEYYDLATLPVSDPPDATWHAVASAPIELFRMVGRDPHLGAKLTGILRTADAGDIDTEAVGFPRRMRQVPNWQTQFVELRERLVNARLASIADVDKVIADFDDESCDLIIHGPTLVSARGRKP